MCLTTDVGGSIPHMTHARMRVVCAIAQATLDWIGRYHLALALGSIREANRCFGYACHHLTHAPGCLEGATVLRDNAWYPHFMEITQSKALVDVRAAIRPSIRASQS
jgi:hypothetical protein